MAEGGEEPQAERPAVEEFDFGKKKKRGKKDKDKATDAPAVDDNVEKAPQVVSTDFERGPVHSYDSLLERLYKTIESEHVGDMQQPRLILPPPQVVRVGSKKVGWVNFAEHCKIMKRPQDHVRDFVLAEFGTEGSISADGQLLVKGNYKEKHAECLLRKYIREFVSCEMCRCPNTILSRDQSTRLYVVTCQNCGASRTPASIKSGFHVLTRADRRAAKQKI